MLGRDADPSNTNGRLEDSQATGSCRLILVLFMSQARPWEVSPGYLAGEEEAPPKTPPDQPIRAHEPRTPQAPAGRRPPPYPAGPLAAQAGAPRRGIVEDVQPPEFERVLLLQQSRDSHHLY